MSDVPAAPSVDPSPLASAEPVASRRAALITGGARRVGKACAIELASRGFDVAVHANTSADEAAALARDLKSRFGVDTVPFAADLTDDGAAEELVRRVVERFGSLDALVNSAAIWPEGPLETATAANVRRCLDVNLVAVFEASRAAGLAMSRQDRGGVVINLGDVATGPDGFPYAGYPAYHASKAGVVGTTRALAVELAARNPRVRVNAVLPGPVLCDTLPGEPPDPPARRRHVRAAALVDTGGGDASPAESGCGRAEHVADAVAFLVENPFVTGVCLPVDGGGRLRGGVDGSG